ncbi:MAG: hypothetical protein V5A63_18655, partial [Bacteroides sp.]
TAKIKTFIYMFQTFSELFCFIIKRSYALSLSHLSRLSSLGKRVQKYTLLEYHPNLFNSFFEVFLKDSAKVLKENDVVEHVFFNSRERGMRMSKETKVIPDALKELKKSIALALVKRSFSTRKALL